MVEYLSPHSTRLTAQLFATIGYVGNEWPVQRMWVSLHFVVARLLALFLKCNAGAMEGPWRSVKPLVRDQQT